MLFLVLLGLSALEEQATQYLGRLFIHQRDSWPLLKRALWKWRIQHYNRYCHPTLPPTLGPSPSVVRTGLLQIPLFL